LGGVIDQCRTALECRIAHTVFDAQAHALIVADVLVFDKTAHRLQHHHVGAFDNSSFASFWPPDPATHASRCVGALRVLEILNAACAPAASGCAVEVERNASNLVG